MHAYVRACVHVCLRVCVCACICAHVCVYACMHACMCGCLCAYMCIHVHMGVCMNAHACVSACECMCLHVCACVHMFMCVSECACATPQQTQCRSEAGSALRKGSCSLSCKEAGRLFSINLFRQIVHFWSNGIFFSCRKPFLQNPSAGKRSIPTRLTQRGNSRPTPPRVPVLPNPIDRPPGALLSSALCQERLWEFRGFLAGEGA